MWGGIWVCLTVGKKESKTPATHPIPSGSSLKVGRLGKPIKRELKGEETDVMFVPPPVVVVEFLFSAFVSKLSAIKISSSFRVAPISPTLVGFLIWSILFPASFLSPASSLLTTTFRLSTVLLSFWPRCPFSKNAFVGLDRGKVEQKQVEIVNWRISRGSGEECLKKRKEKRRMKQIDNPSNQYGLERNVCTHIQDAQSHPRCHIQDA